MFKRKPKSASQSIPANEDAIKEEIYRQWVEWQKEIIRELEKEKT